MLEHTFDVARTRRPHLRVGAIIAVALAAGFISWLVLRSGTDAKPVSSPASPSAVPEIVVPAQLHALAVTLGHPLYWAGANPGMRYELTQATSRNVFIRYLPVGVKVGDRRPDFLTIGTYPERGAFAQTRAAGNRSGAVTMKLADGGIAVYDGARPTSVYFAYPGTGVQVEVYDASGRIARRLVLGGRVVPIK
jgi:hypothetical protein